MKNQLKAIILLVVCLIGISLTGTDWTQWRGPHANSQSDETGWNPGALADNPVILWRAEIGMGHSAFSIKGDRLYTAGEKVTETSTDTTSVEIVYCLHKDTGGEIWQYAFPTRKVGWPGPATTPVIDENTIFYMSRQGTIFSLDALKGTVNWQRDLVAEKLSHYTGWGFCTSPLIEGNLVILNVGEGGLALNKKTGETVWAGKAGPGWVASPTPFTFEGKHQAALISDKNLNVVDVNTGAIQWSLPWNSDADVTVDGTRMLLVGAHRNPGSMLIDFESGQPETIWKSRNVRHTFQNPVIIDGYAYTFGYLRSNNNEPFICIDMKNGDIKWNELLGDHNAQGALMAADEKLILLSVDGKLIIADPSPEGYKPISGAKIFDLGPYDASTGAPDCCWTVPQLLNRKVYARTTHGKMVCVDMK